jgi:putative phosphoesterase
MRLGIVSDTHGNTTTTRQAIELLNALEVDTVLHCGDIGSVAVVDLLARCNWPTHFVLGNTDYDAAELGRAITERHMLFHDQFGDLEFDNCRVALLHSHDQRMFDRVKACGDYQLVCYGHTHAKKIEQVGTTLVLNPGALHRANPHSLAIVDLPQLEAQIIDL